MKSESCPHLTLEHGQRVAVLKAPSAALAESRLPNANDGNARRPQGRLIRPRRGRDPNCLITLPACFATIVCILSVVCAVLSRGVAAAVAAIFSLSVQLAYRRRWYSAEGHAGEG